ncbi:hypothetical protein LPJ59_006441 [Coemansia sp. RSA 2399]|nr:hypothetical protein LPJ59_006441 [Coemansia sp. RSA 2399]KAJ1888147.1 hypothetical protein LPJ81_006385 [Coemansia sp. IMI 209127]
MPIYKDITYIPSGDPKHTLDLYVDDQLRPPPVNRKPALVIYIHGGAWRTGDKSDASALCDGILRTAGGRVAVAAISYRLSVLGDKTRMHPMHLDDAAAAVGFLINSGGYPGSDQVDRSSVFLVGHSAGAQLATMMAVHPHPKIAGCLHRIRGVLGVGGIYDIPELLETNPGYADFIDMAFTAAQHETASPRHVIRSAPSAAKHIAFLLVNSTADELVGPLQSADMARQLICAGYSDVSLIVKDIGTHYGELESEGFWRIVAGFALDRQD